MATPFTSFRPSSDFARTAVDAVLGAAGTRMTMRLLRRYPKTAIALAVAAGASAVLGGVLHRQADQPAERSKPRGKAKPAAS